MKVLAITAATIGLAVSATPAFAGDSELPTQVISTDGLDLDTAEGQRLLDERINRAAREVCQIDQTRTGTRIRSMAARDCLAKATASAKRQVAAMAATEQRGG